jgi:hypothetical protein
MTIFSGMAVLFHDIDDLAYLIMYKALRRFFHHRMQQRKASH